MIALSVALAYIATLAFVFLWRRATPPHEQVIAALKDEVAAVKAKIDAIEALRMVARR
jgi:hypothetical protein